MDFHSGVVSSSAWWRSNHRRWRHNRKQQLSCCALSCLVQAKASIHRFNTVALFHARSLACARQGFANSRLKTHSSARIWSSVCTQALHDNAGVKNIFSFRKYITADPQNLCSTMTEKITSEKITSSADFSAIWKAALVEFHANTKISLANETKLLNLQNIDELISYLKKEYAEYDKDSASSSFANTVKSSLGSLRFLLAVGDRAAGNVSWIFGARDRSGFD